MEFSESLKKTKDFRTVYQTGTSTAERKFVLYVRKNGTERNRLGISVSKKVGNSVVRHRIARLVRESYRHQEACFCRGVDLIVVARVAAAGCTQDEVNRSLRYLGRALQIWEAPDENRAD